MARRRSFGSGIAVFSLGLWLCFHFLGHGPVHASGSKAKIIGYAMAQQGKPYLLGGTGPDAFDCSGLVMMAYRQIGVTFGSTRPTAADEWHYGPRTSHPVPGDLVFFAGADGTANDPGHIGIYLAPHRMIDAYGRDTVVRVESFGLPSSAGGLQYPTGYTGPG